MDWERVQAIFGAVVDLSPAERATYFADADIAADDLAEVERLLREHDKPGSFLDSPVLPLRKTEVLSADWEAPPEAEVGRRLGPYTLRRVIGEGGMGRVYLATRADEEFEREVAVKLIRYRHDAESLVRFRNERQILAGLEHTYIARLYDGGTAEDGSPFLVMEYVEGVRLDSYATKHALSVRDRLHLFQKICAAVDYAHRNLLVHRDLKPSNILINADGVPKLLDFGIAKSLAGGRDGRDAGTTRPGQHPMTPAYASPEQVVGRQITTASDVYSLGVVLYELLTGGKSPYELEDADSDLKLQTAIRDHDPVKPSVAARTGETTNTLGRQLRGDLDTIVLKALRKEPQHRYATAAAFAGDIGRYLDDMPVLARSAGLSYRLRKFTRRHRLGVAAGVLVAVVLVGFLIALIRQTQVSNQERERAELTLDAFVDAFSASDPEQAQGREVTVREMLDQGADKVRRSLATNPKSLATLLAAMGEVYTSLGIFDTAESLHGEAHELRRGGTDEGLSLFQRGELEWWRRDYRAAEDFYRQSLRLLADPVHRNDSVHRARILRGLGLALVRQGKQDEGEALLAEALTVLRGHFDDADPEILRVLDGLALAAVTRADYASASERYRQVIAARRTFGAGPALGRSLAGLGGALHELGQLEDAATAYGEAVPLLRDVMGGSENVYVAEVLGEYVALRLELGALQTGEEPNHGETESLLGEILAMRGGVLPASHPTIAVALRNLAPILAGRSEFEEATSAASEALELEVELFGPTHEWVAASLCNLGMIAKAARDYPTAREHFQECAVVLERLHPEGHPQLAFPWSALGFVAKSEGGCSAAKPWFRRALDIRREHLGSDHFLTKQTAGHLEDCAG